MVEGEEEERKRGMKEEAEAVDASMRKVPVIGVIENMSGLVCPYCGR